MKSVLYIKGSSLEDVRVGKFLDFFAKNGDKVIFWGWNRGKNNINIDGVLKYDVFQGGGESNKILLLYYPIWMIILFFKSLFSCDIINYNVIAINFDCAFPVYLASKIRRFKYIYEIYDEFAISYRFPKWLKSILQKIDTKIMESAVTVVHVDKNRIRNINCHNIVIENTPYDYFGGKERDYDNITHTFAVTGLLNNIRGLDQIILFAKKHKNITFLAIGRVTDKKQIEEIKNISNIKLYDYMPQKEVFALLKNCCGIFSLYNPNLEINRLAASNKVYDAMMLGIPVITNPEVLNSNFIKKQKIGCVVNYTCDSSWEFLASEEYLSDIEKIGRNGRDLYLREYSFPTIVKERLCKILKS
ncbi:hypothetical protein FACS189416_2100 [Bacteroidia bacterium]|nr:hypothetical protein FACS189416_2100 [Bacteroidia bacterium]